MGGVWGIVNSWIIQLLQPGSYINIHIRSYFCGSDKLPQGPELQDSGWVGDRFINAEPTGWISASLLFCLRLKLWGREQDLGMVPISQPGVSGHREWQWAVSGSQAVVEAVFPEARLGEWVPGRTAAVCSTACTWGHVSSAPSTGPVPARTHCKPACVWRICIRKRRGSNTSSQTFS